MKPIIKAQLYQLRKDKLLYIVFALSIFLQCTTMIGEADFTNTVGATGTVLLPAGDYVAGCGMAISSFALIFALFFTADVCGADFIDKTTNYELMSGHGRNAVYFGRAVLSIIGGTLGSMLICAFPVIIGMLVSGWGNSISLGDVLLRYLLSVFPIIRIICEFVFVTFLVKNAYIMMAAGIFISLYGVVIPEMFRQGTAEFLGLTSLAKLYDFSAWSTYTLVGVKNIVIYDAALKAGEVVPIILASVIFGALFLMMGYWFFKKDDLH